MSQTNQTQQGTQDDLQTWMADHERKGKPRHPFVSKGSYTLEMCELRPLGQEEKIVGVGADGKEVVITRNRVDAYVAEAKVIGTDNPSHPVGSMVAVYYSMLPNPNLGGQSEEGLLLDLFYAFVRSVGLLGEEPFAAMREKDPARAKQVEDLYRRFKREPDLMKGVKLGLHCPQKKRKDGSPVTTKTGEPICHRNWRPVPGQGA